jgi:hypothetical protein
LDDLPEVYNKLSAQQPKVKKAAFEASSIILENMIRKAVGEGELKPQDEIS